MGLRWAMIPRLTQGAFMRIQARSVSDGIASLEAGDRVGLFS